MTPHRHADVLRAIADGREVEYSYDFGNNWNDAYDKNPIAHDGYKWRVKPVPVIRYEYLLWNEARNAYNKWDVGVSHWDIKITFEDDKPIKVEAK
jgi:hypothetical protein